MADAQEQINKLASENLEFKRKLQEYQNQIQDQEEETNTLKEKIKRDSEKITKHIRQSSQELLDEKHTKNLIQQLAVVKTELTELSNEFNKKMSQTTSKTKSTADNLAATTSTSNDNNSTITKSSDNANPQTSTTKMNTSSVSNDSVISNEETQTYKSAKKKITSLIDLCTPGLENIKLPDILNESLEKIKHLEDMINNLTIEKNYLEQRNCQLEEELDHRTEIDFENKQSREQLSVYVDKLRLILEEKHKENENLKDTIFILNDEVEQAKTVHKYDQHLIEKYSREVDQIENQKVEVQKKYDQVLRNIESRDHEFNSEINEMKVKIDSLSRENDNLMKNVVILKDENKNNNELVLKLQVSIRAICKQKYKKWL